MQDDNAVVASWLEQPSVSKFFNDYCDSIIEDEEYLMSQFQSAFDDNAVVVIYVNYVDEHPEDYDAYSYIESSVWVIPRSLLSDTDMEQLKQKSLVKSVLDTVNRQYCHSVNDLPYIEDKEIVFVTQITYERSVSIQVPYCEP